MCINKFEGNYTEKSKKSRTSKAKAIFYQGLDKEALENIINSSKVDKVDCEKAKLILANEFIKT